MPNASNTVPILKEEVLASLIFGLPAIFSDSKAIIHLPTARHKLQEATK